MDSEKKKEIFFDETVDLVKLQFTDLFGQCKMVEMTRNQAKKVLKDGYAVNRFALGGLKKEGGSTFPIPEFLKDCGEGIELYLKPEMDTFRVLPWESGQETVGRVICAACNPDGTPSWADPRNALKETWFPTIKIRLKAMTRWTSCLTMLWILLLSLTKYPPLCSSAALR